MNNRLRYRFLYGVTAILALFLVASEMTFAAASIEVVTTPIEVKGEITSVTLYSSEARVERTLAIAEGVAGLRQVVVGPLPATLIDSSIQVEGTDGLASVSVQVHRSSGEPVESARVKDQRTQLKELQQSLLRLKREDQSLKEMRARFASILPNRSDDEDTPPNIDLVAWQGLLDLVQQGMERAASSRSALASRLREAQDKVQQARRSLDLLLQNQERARAEVHIGIQDLNGAGGVIRISYLIPNANWRPHYEVDVDTVNHTLQLRAFAIVRQMTGEDWPEVPVSFSTSAPELGSDIPDLAAIRLNRPRYQDLPLEEAEITRLGRQVLLGGTRFRTGEMNFDGGTVLGGEEFYSYALAGGKLDHILPVFSNRGFLRTFSSVKPEQIPSDGESHRLLYAIKQLDFDEERICAPELNTAVFRRIIARVTGSDPLLHGTVAVFLGEDYLGQAIIQTTAPGEEMVLDLGVDGQVTVKRIQRDSEEQVGIFSKAIHYRTDLELVVENFHSDPITVSLRERIPFTESDQLRVQIDRSATTHLPEGLESDDGLLSWSLEVSPGEATKVRLVWWIAAPPDVQLTRREAPERLGKGE